jgi:cytochrome c oxidase assembly factor CtaG
MRVGSRPLAASALLAAIWLAASDAATAFAHPGEPPQPHDLWTAWLLNGWTLAGLMVSSALYARGYQAWRRRGRQLGWRAAAFVGGCLALAAALLTPLDPLGHALFAAHMAQHLLLILLAAPLLAWSAPLGPLLLGLPSRAGARIGHWWQRAERVQAAWRLLSSPAVAWGLHAAALWAWHAPVFYEAALVHEGVHALEHFSFFATALLFWWALLHPGRSGWLAGPGGALYVFTMALQSGFLGALMTLSQAPWYPAYATTTQAWGLTALEDQQLAGVVMWMPAGIVYLGAALGVLGLWLAEMDRRDMAGAALPASEPVTGGHGR